MMEDAERELKAAAERLSCSDEGREALKLLKTWFDGSGLHLDGANQNAICKLLVGAWGSHAGTTRDAIEQALKR